MDTVPLVENQIDEGQQLLDRLRDAGFVVRAACWLKRGDRDRWSLYIATPLVDEKGSFEAYGQLAPVLQSLGDEWLTRSPVTLVGEEHRLVPYALDILRHFPHKAPIKPPRSLGGGMSVEAVYVYPPGKTNVTIYPMLFPGAPAWPSILSFDPVSCDGGVWLEEEKIHRGDPGVDCVVAAPKGAKLERNETGQRVLAWDDLHGNRKHSNANEVWTLPKLGLRGFRFLEESATVTEPTP